MQPIIHSRSQGEGYPIVLIHGLFGSLENLGVLAKALAEGYKVYSIDLPNHGRSFHADSMTLSSMAADVERWMDKNAIERAHFIGHSLGGKVAMELALASTHRVAKLAVIDIAPVLYEPHHTAIFEGLLALDITHLKSRALADDFLSPFVPDLAVRSFLLKNLVKADAGFVWRMNLAAIVKHYASLIGANRHDTAFNGDVLFLKGGDSPYIQNDHKDAIAARFPTAKLRIIPSVGHWLHAEKPDHVSKILLNFLSAN